MEINVVTLHKFVETMPRQMHCNQNKRRSNKILFFGQAVYELSGHHVRKNDGKVFHPVHSE